MGHFVQITTELLASTEENGKNIIGVDHLCF